MTRPLFSPSWYRVANLTPRLRGHAQIHRHRFRGKIWFVLQDLSSDRFHRFTPETYQILGLMDGKKTVQSIWDLACERLGDDSPTQEEMIQLLSQLHAADVLQCNVPPDVSELFDRHKKKERQKWQNNLLNPLSWRFSLLDPESFLQRALPVVRPLISWFGALVWLAVVGTAVVLAAEHWTDLTQNVLDRLLTVQNLAVIWILFPVVKVLHEFGHAFVTKSFGGEVHDMGVLFLVLTPIPYVDASSAWTFQEKKHRVVVGAAGMVVELFLASLALFAWLNLEPGVVRTLMYNTMIIAGVATVLFNGNPLLRYDGYYILMDLVEIPNLRQRSTTYVLYLCERYLFGSLDAQAPEASAGERAWFIGYSIAGFLYRLFIMAVILLFIAGKLFFLGVILAFMAAGVWTVMPLVKGGHFLLTNPRLRPVRARAIAVTVLVLAALAGALALVPVPLNSRAEGVIWLPDEAYVRAGIGGFVDQVAAAPGSRVRAGETLIVCRDPSLTAETEEDRARVTELQARYNQQWQRDRVKAQIIQEELDYERQRLDRALQRQRELMIRSRTAGTFVVPDAQDLPGRFVRQGELLGFVVDPDRIMVRAVVSQRDIDLVRNRTRKVQVRLSERISRVLPAVIKRIVPGATADLPSMALGSQGGGDIAVDPTDTRGVKSVDKLFEVDLDLPSHTTTRVGERVYVRFDHGWEPLLEQWYRRLRQLFLSRFNV